MAGASREVPGYAAAAAAQRSGGGVEIVWQRGDRRVDPASSKRRRRGRAEGARGGQAVAVPRRGMEVSRLSNVTAWLDMWKGIVVYR